MDDEVAGAGTASQDRRPALEVSQDRHRHDQRLPTTEIAADDTAPQGSQP